MPSQNQFLGDMSLSAASPQRPRRTGLARRCSLCIKIFKWFPVVFIVAVLSWGYYAYVIQLCIFTIESVILQVVYLIIFHVFYTLTMWSYWQTIFTDIGRIPREVISLIFSDKLIFLFNFQFYLPPTERELLLKERTEEGQKQVLDRYVAERGLPIQCRAYNGMYRICEKCFMIKPDRAHHCSVCNSCVLKMDHHCPWYNYF